jgi:FkbM family methyltransferase
MEAWKYIAENAKNQITIFGAGHLGRKVLRSLLAVGLPPLAILDNKADLCQKTFENILILHPNKALDQLGSDVLIILAVYNTSKPRDQLKALGFKRIIHCANVFAGMPDVALPFFCLDDTDIIFKNGAQVKKVFELMADEASKDLYVAQIRYRLYFDFDYVLRPQTNKMRASEYFPSDIYRFLDDEILVDCGAFTGDTVNRFLNIRNEKFKQIYAFEPDKKNYTVLVKSLNDLPSTINAKIKPLNQGVSNSPGLVSFQSDGTVFSLASTKGKDVATMVRLDEALSETIPTLIKMDIEGAEIDALHGCTEIIRAHRPVFAICVYHASQHLWEVPLLISNLCHNYQFFLRAHAEDCWDVTCYAVPSERVMF